MFPLSLLRSRARTLGLQRLDAGDGAAHLADPRRLLKLAGRRLEAEVERLALQLAELIGELVVGHGCQFALLHLPAPKCEVSPRRATTLTLIGSFIAARLNAT